MDPSYYDADYFLRGQESGKSLYTDYRWLPDLTVPMAKAIALHLKMQRGETVLDFGCARGYLVKALAGIGYRADGYDPSQWVIDHCDPEVADMVSSSLDPRRRDWVIAKDVLEHVEHDALHKTIKHLAGIARKGLFIVVPLSHVEGEPYVVPEYEKDVTHIIRMPLMGWVREIYRTLGERRWDVTATYRVEGVKDNYYTNYPEGNGFITVRPD